MNTPTTIALKQQIKDAQAERATLENLPSVEPLKADIQRLTTQAILSPEKYRADLQKAVSDLAALDQKHARRAELNGQISKLTTDLNMAESDLRRQYADDADNRLKQAYREYVHACKVAVAAHRQCLNVVQANRQIPGTSVSLPPTFAEFHVPHLHPAGWTGTTGVLMRDMPKTPWEDDPSLVAPQVAANEEKVA